MKNEVIVDLDADGVLFDFFGAANALHDIDSNKCRMSWNWYEHWGLTYSQFWNPINALGDDFYARHVNIYPWAQTMVAAIQQLGVRVRIVTASGDNTGLNGKAAAIRKWFPSVKEVFILVGTEYYKGDLAASNSILVDDKIENIEEYIAQGGQGYLFPHAMNGGTFDCKTVQGILDMIRALQTGKTHDVRNERLGPAGVI